MPLIEDALRKSKKNLKFNDLLDDSPPSSTIDPTQAKSRPVNLFDLDSILIKPTPTISSQKINQNPKKTRDELETKWSQTRDKVETKVETNLGQSGVNREAETKTRDKVEPQLETQPETKWSQTRDKVETKLKFESLVGLKRKIVLFLFEVSKAERAETTPAITIEHLATCCNCPKSSVKKTIQRLEKDQAIRRVTFKDGRGGWTKYCLDSSFYNQLLNLESRDKLETKWSQTRDKVGAQLETQPETSPPSSSSSYNKTTTTEEGGVVEKLQSAVERFSLIEKHIDLNDLMKIWRKGIFKTLEDFLASVEHAAFYLQTPQACGIEKPKGWFYSNLSKGFFAPPSGFRSWEERQLEVQVKAAHEKAERIRQMKEKLLQDKFEIWFNEMSKERKIELLKGKTFSGNLEAFSAKLQLRQIFDQEIGEGED